MIADYEAAVAARFDALHGRFKARWPQDDPRLLGIVEVCGRWPAVASSTWAAARGGSPGRWAIAGRSVVGLDVSAAMLAGADGAGLDRVRASARRLPFGPSSFDAAIAVEVFEHLAPRAVDAGLCRGAARAPAGRDVRRGRQEPVFLERAAPLAAQRGGEVDRRTARPVDVSPSRDGAGAMVPAGRAAPAAGALVRRGPGRPPALASRGGPVPVPAGAGRATLRGCGRRGRREDSHETTLLADSRHRCRCCLWQTPPGLELMLAQEGVPFETVKDAHPLSFRGGRFVLFDGRRSPPRIARRPR